MSPKAAPVIFGLLGIAAFLPLAAGQADQGTSLPPSHDEVPGGDYLVGYLSWTTGAEKGVVVWKPDPGTADPGGPPAGSLPSDAQRAATSYAGWHVRTASGGRYGKDLVTTIEIVSDPLPVKAYLNVSKVVQLDLSVATSTDYGFDTEVHVGNRRLGGAIEGVRPATHSTNPAGYVLQKVRFFPEIDTIEKSEVITIRLTYDYDLGPQAPLRLGLKEPHQSILRIPLYPPEEVLARRPEFAGVAKGAADPSESGTGADPLIPMVFLASLALFRGTRRGKAAPLLALALLLSGCASRAGPRADLEEDAGRGTQSVRVVRDEEQLLTSGKLGAVLGTVKDDYGAAVPAAFVLLMPSGDFADTDSRGRFTFQNLTPGRFSFRIDKSAFHSFDGALTVSPGHVTKVEVTMEPLKRKVGDFRPHSHDYWPPEGKKTVFEGDLTFANLQATTGVKDAPAMCSNMAHPFYFYATFALSQRNSYCGVPFDLPYSPEDPNLILPGTREVDVTVTWDEDDEFVERVGVMAQTNLAPCRTCYGPNWTIAYPRGSGDTIRILGAWENTDVGHQLYSVWRWVLYLPMNNANTMNFMAQVSKVKYHVKVEILKGVVPVEPGHPDFWETNQTITIVAPGAPWNQGWRPTHIVPPETVWLEIRQAMSAGTNNDLFVAIKTAKMPPSTRVEDYRRLTPTETTDTEKVYRVALEPGEADGFYAKSSQWNFWHYNSGTGTRGTFEQVTSFSVVAHRDALPA